MKESLEIDKESGNVIWYRAIDNKMVKSQVDFEILDGYTPGDV